MVAYFQPVTRVVIDQVRGVDSAHSLALLLDRELVAPCGSLDAPGRPILYRTTPVFLRSFGLSSLEELPPLPESGLNREGGTAMVGWILAGGPGAGIAGLCAPAGGWRQAMRRGGLG